MNLPDPHTDTTEYEILELLAALIRVRRPEVVVEAGTLLGHGAVYMADACRENGTGHVWTYDVQDHGIPKLLADSNLSDWCTFKHMDFLADIKPYIDFAFIDASAEGDDGARLREQHFRAVKSRLTPKGIICVHDTRKDDGADWRDGEGGKSMHRIRKMCQLNLDLGRGLSIFYRDV